ncbi:MAG TPA: efflux RND transporter periplasmic adaptor subunit [Gemmatimonadaceae bacterium]
MKLNGVVLLVPFFLASCNRGDRGAIVATGTLEVIEVDVSPLSAGRVARVLVDDGDTVQTGDTLAILVQPASGAEIAERQAQVGVTRAGLLETERGSRAPEIARAAAELRAAQAEATRTATDAARARALFRSGAIARQQLDAAEAAAREAAGRRDAANQQLILLRQGSRIERVESARAQVAGAQAGLTAAQATVSDLTLLAPIDGVVLSRNAQPGEVVTPGQSAITLGDIKRPWVRVYVGEKDVPQIRVGSRVIGQLDGLPNRRFNGRVVAINTKAEFTPKVALTEEERADLKFGVKVEFDDTTGALRPGLPITVTIPRISGADADNKR